MKSAMPVIFSGRLVAGPSATSRIADNYSEVIGVRRERAYSFYDPTRVQTVQAGVPIIVGGPAFGYDDVRAKALGATAWAADAHCAVSTTAALPAVVAAAAPLPAVAATEQGNLAHDHRRIVAALRAGWSLTSGPPPVPEVAEDVLNQLLHAVWAVLLTGDPRPVPETAAWIVDLMATRGIDTAVVRELGDRGGGHARGLSPGARHHRHALRPRPLTTRRTRHVSVDAL